MDKTNQSRQPAQVPGDAESPAKGKSDRSIKQAVRHSDKTEPVQSARKDKHEQSR